MKCTEFEVLLAGYVDDVLDQPTRAQLEQHAADCAKCRELLKDVAGAVTLLRCVEEVAVPPELVTRIAYQAPRGRVPDAFDQPGWWSRLTRKWLQPLLQPRLAMGMAMTILSFAMLERCTGVRVQRIQSSDLNPVRIWSAVEDRAMRVRDRAVNYYENLRWVYEIEVRLKDLQQQQESLDDTKAPPAKAPSQKSANGPHGAGTAGAAGTRQGDKQ